MISLHPRRTDNLFEIEKSGILDSHCHHKSRYVQDPELNFSIIRNIRLVMCVTNITEEARDPWVELTVNLHVIYHRIRHHILSKMDQPHCWRKIALECGAEEPW